MRIITTTLFAAVALGLGASAQTTIFSDDFESGFSRWSMTDLWNAQNASEPCTQVAVPFPSGTNCAWYGSSVTCSFIDGDWAFQHLTCTEPIVLPATTGVLELRFRSFSEGEDDGIWDTRRPQISVDDGATWTALTTVLSSDHWLDERIDLSAYAHQTVRLRFTFWIGDWAYNDMLGWLVDDVQILETAGPAVQSCSGDGTWFGCPCGNTGAAGRGCATSFNPAGAQLVASGRASIASDTLVLAADGMSEAAATIFQGVHLYATSFAIAGDGVACIGAPFVRIRTLAAPGGVIAYPGPFDPTISVRGGITVPNTMRTYAVRYRNAAAFCTSATFNVTNMLQVTWRP